MIPTIKSNFTNTEQLRSGNHRFLSLESALFPVRASRTDPSKYKIRLWRHHRPDSHPTWQVRTYLQTENCRFFENIDYRKELEIRRTLSSSHLFSSAFVVDKGELKNGVPEWFLLTGAGWGHGVGLCQIGAAVMGERGYTYDEILLHYYKGADIRRFY